MNWDGVENLVKSSKSYKPHASLLARQIYSGGHFNPYYGFLQKLIALESCELGIFLEIGCEHGCTAAHYSITGTALTYVGIDINPVPFSSFDTVFIHGDSIGKCSNGLETVDVVKRMVESLGGIQYVFQDSSHHYAASKREWELYSPLVRPGGLWIADDITEAFKIPGEEKGMVEYWDELPGDKRLYDNLHIGSRIGIVRM